MGAGQWWLVNDYGDGRPIVGPFDTYADAAAYDPTDDRLEARHYPNGLASDGEAS